jgi:[ribosomal protein S5]-alanine N-acetyltransferase
VKVAETTRLRLRQFEQRDAPFIVELLTDPEFLRNIGDRGVHDEADAQRYIASGPVASYARNGFGLYKMELKDSSTAIGMCGLLRRDTHPDVEIGFALLPKYRRTGYTLEAARAVMQLAQHVLGLTRVVAITAPDNAASIRILERLNMKFAGMVHYTSDGGVSRLFVWEPAAGARE